MIPPFSYYVECPDEWNGGGPSVFLAGGITACPDWQSVAADWLQEHKVVSLNPRRANFPIDDPAATDFQIKWEFRHLHYADAILFWFPKAESPQPIALYELGRHAALERNIVVGCEPGYLRQADVRHQMRLARPELKVHRSLGSALQAMKDVLS